MTAATRRPSLFGNPVLRRELIERVKGVRPAIFVSVWLLLLTGVLLLAYFGSIELIESQQNGGVLDIGSLGRIGRQVYEWVLFGMLLLILFLVPGLTASAITGERERQTLVSLQLTLMRPIDIVLGKLAAALAFLILLVVAAFPLLAASLLVGGVGVFDVVRGVGTLLFTGLVLGSVCVMLSALLSRTTGATVVSYATSLIFAIGAFVAILVWVIVNEAFLDGTNDYWVQILGFNPFAGIADALPRGGQIGNDTDTPFGAIRDQIDQAGAFRERGPRIWIWYYGIGIAVLVLSVWTAARSVRTPAETER